MRIMLAAMLMGGLVICQPELRAQDAPAKAGETKTGAAKTGNAEFADVIARYPAGDILKRLFPSPPAALPADFEPTGLTKKDYLKLAAGVVDFWKNHQNAAGAIIDFYDKDAKHPDGQEIQYSTPAFALASAELVKEAGRDDLLEPSVRAFSFALTALQNKTTANGHADFYIPMLMHAHRILESRVPRETADKWAKQFESLIPEKTYRDVGGNGNWNLVNVSGDAMRRKDHLVASDQMDAQQAYLDKMLDRQLRQHFSRFGTYLDAPAPPMAYDAFPRLWLEDMTADHAYDGPQLEKLRRTLELGSFSSLLFFSPSGEWACGGRSAQHQWNEAENAVIGEVNAARWEALGRPDIAGAFKRMAHLGLQSMFRWQRPSGELWIVKNYAPPAERFGFEGYSFNSQYNLLPMGMLCIAYERADESVRETPLPAEYGTYVFDAHDPTYKVVAASGGYYALIETTADAHYNGTGLQRIHRRGVALSPLSDSGAPQRIYGAKKGDPQVGLTPGIQWKVKADGDGTSLADFHHYEPPPRPKPGHMAPMHVLPQKNVTSVDVHVAPTTDNADVTIRYKLEGPDAEPIVEHYQVSSGGVHCTQTFGDGATPVAAARFAFPALVNDGARDTKITSEAGKLAIERSGGILNLSIAQPPDAKLELIGPKIATHNGYLQAAAAPLPDVSQGVDWTATLEPAPLTKPVN